MLDSWRPSHAVRSIALVDVVEIHCSLNMGPPLAVLSIMLSLAEGVCLNIVSALVEKGENHSSSNMHLLLVMQSIIVGLAEGVWMNVVRALGDVVEIHLSLNMCLIMVGLAEGCGWIL